MGLGIVRVQLGRLGELRRGLGGTPEIAQRGAEIEMRLGKARAQADGGSAGRLRFGGAAAVAQRIAEVGPRLDVIRLERDGLAIGCLGLAESAELVKHDAEIGPRLGIVRPQAPPRARSRRGPRHDRRGRKAHAEEMVGPGVALVLRDGLPIELDRRSDVAGLLLLERRSYEIDDARARWLNRKLRRVALRVALDLVVIDPELGLALLHHRGEAIHRRQRLVLVGIARRDAPVVPIVPEMGGIAAEDDPAGLGQMDEQRFMAGVWPGVERIVTEPSPNTSLSPSSFMTG